MRLSISKDDKSYDLDKAINCRVLFNGKECKDAITADEELGMVLVYKKNKQGKSFLDYNGEIATEKLYGKVKLEFPNEK